MRRMAIVLALAVSRAAVADISCNAWTNAPLGIAVTRCDYSTRGVSVRFETDIEPPFVVGVYRPREGVLGRRYPVAEVETSTKIAFIPGNFTDATLILQVMTKAVVDRYADDDFGRRVLTPAEWREYAAVVKNAEPYVNSDASVSFEAEAENRMELVEDDTWAGFVKTDQTNLCYTIEGRRAEPAVESVETNIVQDVVYTNVTTYLDVSNVVMSVLTNAGVFATTNLELGDRRQVVTNTYADGGCVVTETDSVAMHNDHVGYSTNYSATAYSLVPHEYTFRIRNGRSDIGTGYRIMVFEDVGVCQAQRAYSARTNMSDTVVLPRGFRALSSHGGYVYTTDWEGRRYFQKVTNRVDHVFGK